MHEMSIMHKWSHDSMDLRDNSHSVQKICSGGVGKVPYGEGCAMPRMGNDITITALSLLLLAITVGSMMVALLYPPTRVIGADMQ